MIKIGDSVSITRSYSDNDIEAYSRLSGVGVQEITSIPEPLIGAMYSDMLGTKLPGEGTMYMKQTSQYLSPADLNDKLTAKVEISRIRTDKGLVNLRTTCTNQDGVLVGDGEALVLYLPCKVEDKEEV